MSSDGEIETPGQLSAELPQYGSDREHCRICCRYSDDRECSLIRVEETLTMREKLSTRAILSLGMVRLGEEVKTAFDFVAVISQLRQTVRANRVLTLSM